MGRLMRGTKKASHSTLKGYEDRFSERAFEIKNEQKTKQKRALERLKAQRATKTGADSSVSISSHGLNQPNGVHKNVKDTISRYESKRFQEKLRQGIGRKVDLKAIKTKFLKPKVSETSLRIVTENNGSVVAKREPLSEDDDCQQWMLIKNERDVARNPFSNNTLIKWRRLDKLNLVRSRMVSTFRGRHTEFERFDGSSGIFQWDNYDTSTASSLGRKDVKDKSRARQDARGNLQFPTIFDNIQLPPKSVAVTLPKRKGTIKASVPTPSGVTAASPRIPHKPSAKRTHAVAFDQPAAPSSRSILAKDKGVQHPSLVEPPNRYKLSQAKRFKPCAIGGESGAKQPAEAPIPKTSKQPLGPQRSTPSPGQRKEEAETKLRTQAYQTMTATPLKPVAVSTKASNIMSIFHDPKSLRSKIRKVKVTGQEKGSESTAAAAAPKGVEKPNIYTWEKMSNAYSRR